MTSSLSAASDKGAISDYTIGRSKMRSDQIKLKFDPRAGGNYQLRSSRADLRVLHTPPPPPPPPNGLGKRYPLSRRPRRLRCSCVHVDSMQKPMTTTPRSPDIRTPDMSNPATRIPRESALRSLPFGAGVRDDRRVHALPFPRTTTLRDSPAFSLSRYSLHLLVRRQGVAPYPDMMPADTNHIHTSVGLLRDRWLLIAPLRCARCTPLTCTSAGLRWLSKQRLAIATMRRRYQDARVPTASDGL
ncbi:hypothetical protein DAEQUDRAFT_542633 [Daedalea quercina L-15889]|uniref:Uncharacterized protein n=1 Tax=Daedalea quercina L-15889 TaxID=1314783 RepID=A0A165M4C4_9APHY|nr:hypothetical protein DAEQUDRAFT_542633 [Daedalea quercina L-15889]